jgi:hypothetical protein
MHDVWFPFGESTSPKTRTDKQEAFDKGVSAAAEFVRRMMDGDESIALPIMQFCTTHLNSDYGKKKKPQPKAQP